MDCHIGQSHQSTETIGENVYLASTTSAWQFVVLTHVENGGSMARLIPSILMIVALFANGAFGAGLTDSLKAGKPELKSVAQLAFGPEGILFVGDSRQAAIFAIATENTKPAT